MRVLVACEFSGVVREAFRAKGHEAWSCDLLPAEDGSPFHIQQDVLPVAYGGDWGMMIAHPPCTFLCSSGLHWNKRMPGRDAKTTDALEFVTALLHAPILGIALENPIGRISTAIRAYDQKIQPWQFGHDASKGTCLWLQNLPPLKPTKIVPPKGYRLVKYAFENPICEGCGEEPWCEEHQMHYADCECIGPTQDEATYRLIEGYEFATLVTPAPRPVWANQTPSGQNKLGPSDNRWAERSRTYAGIAAAMADQWGAA